MNTKVKVIIIILSAVIVVTAVAGVMITRKGKNNNDDEVTETQSEIVLQTAQQSVAPLETAPLSETQVFTEAQTTVTAAQTETQAATTVPVSTQPAPTQPQETLPPATEAPVTAAPTVPETEPSLPLLSMSVDEVVNLYNTSVNKVKSTASQITRNYNHVDIPQDSLELPPAIQGIGKTAIGTFVKPDNTPQIWNSKEDFKIGFPVGNTDYSSKMTPDMVESATCADNGNSYQIEIKLKDDDVTSPAKGEGYAGVFNTTTASTFSDINIPTVTFNDVRINGINGSVSATVDKATSNITHITFRNTDVMYLNVKVAFSAMEAKMNLVQESDFTIVY